VPRSARICDNIREQNGSSKISFSLIHIICREITGEKNVLGNAIPVLGMKLNRG